MYEVELFAFFRLGDVWWDERVLLSTLGLAAFRHEVFSEWNIAEDFASQRLTI